jgi:hypothetical protein
MHSCPECDEACYCGGDIDDLQWDDDSEEALACEHECEPEMDEPDFDMNDVSPSPIDPHVARCRVCGCSEFDVCPGGCVWATMDLCSRCVR